MEVSELKDLLRDGNPAFWAAMKTLTAEACDFAQLFLLSSWRKKARARGIPDPGSSSTSLRLAVLGGCSLYPFHELLEHLCEIQGTPVELWLGEYDNYISEIMDPASGLHGFAPRVVVLLPSENRCQPPGGWLAPREARQAGAKAVADALLDLARKVHEAAGAEVILANFMLPERHDLGAFRSRTPGSDWTFRKWVNLELGLNAPAHVQVCDLEFLASRMGGLRARDPRAWFESKQPGSPALLVELARETAHLIASLRRAPKKVLVLDLDNTLWGGVVAEDGLEGIELGDTSPRGEAFKAFQKYILSLKERGVLLAVCSKNDHAVAMAPFERHPDMVLRLADLAGCKANWEPKSENLRALARDLNLGLDSFVFVDDNPAEIEIVRQFTPEVTTILLGPDPAEYAAMLADCRLFEPRAISSEDAARTGQYQADARRRELAAAVTDMESYLASLEMEAVIREFTPVDVPRLAQLINKSNQFNLTTRRRSEGEVTAVMNHPDFIGYSVRLKDRFGDHGLISIVIGHQAGGVVNIDTWLMSCRVLKRQVEAEALNELARLAGARGCARLAGTYLRSPKNEMVRDFYAQMGFTLTAESEAAREFELALNTFRTIPTKIKITRRAYEPD